MRRHAIAPRHDWRDRAGPMRQHAERNERAADRAEQDHPRHRERARLLRRPEERGHRDTEEHQADGERGGDARRQEKEGKHGSRHDGVPMT